MLIWAPILTHKWEGSREDSSEFYEMVGTNCMVILVGGHASSFLCTPEDLLEATSEAAEAHPALELLS